MTESLIFQMIIWYGVALVTAFALGWSFASWTIARAERRIKLERRTLL